MTQQPKTERERFEAWAVRCHGIKTLSDPDAGSMWSAWQAARSIPSGAELPALTDELELAKAIVRGAGYSLVTARFIINFSEFVQDWRKGDFNLPPLAALDMESCFNAWQEVSNLDAAILATSFQGEPSK